MKQIENYCNGCLECRCCGREKDVVIEVCTACEEVLDGEIYEIDTEYYCRSCAWEELTTNYKDEVLSKYKTN